MAAITSSGLGSGLDIEALVSQLVSAERTPKIKDLTTKAAAGSAKLTALGTVRGALSSFQGTARALSGTAQFLTPAVSSSDATAVGATALGTAAPGSYSVEVSALAQSQRLKSGAFSSPDAIVGTGKLIIDFGTISGTADSNGVYTGATFATNAAKSGGTFTITSANQTLSGIRDTINAAGSGLSASIVNDGGGFRLVVSSSETGAKSAIRITVSDDDGTSVNQSGLSQLAYDPMLAQGSGQNLTEVQSARSASFKVNGIPVTSESNSASGIVSGLTFVLLKTTTSPITLSVGRDSTAAAKSIESFVKSYNDLRKTLADVSFYNKDTKQAGALQGESVIRALQSQIRSVVNGVLPGGTYSRLSQVGISFAKDGAMTFDSSKFNTAMSNDAASVAALFGSYGITTDSQVLYASASAGTVAGKYGVNVSQLASQATLTGAALPAPSFTVDANNDTFKIKVDGTESGTITLAAGTYTAAQMVTELQTQIDADPTLTAGKVTVSYDSNARQFSFVSTTTGSGSSVAITTVDTNSANTLGLRVATGTSGSTGVAGKLAADVPVVIDADNDTLTVMVDDYTSNPISISQGTYASAAEVAAAIQAKINADSVLKGGGVSASVSFDSATGQMVFKSSRFGSASKIGLINLDTNSTSTLGLSVATGTAGVDVAGSIGGVAASASGQFLTGSGSASGLRIQITGGSTGERGSVSLNRGFAYQMDVAIESLLSSNGALQARQNSLDALSASIDRQGVELERRLADLEKRYRAQFSTLDRIVGGLRATSTYLTQQLASLPSASGK